VEPGLDRLGLFGGKGRSFAFQFAGGWRRAAGGFEQAFRFDLERPPLDPGILLGGLGKVELTGCGAGSGLSNRDLIIRHDLLRNKHLCRQFKT